MDPVGRTGAGEKFSVEGEGVTDPFSHLLHCLRHGGGRQIVNERINLRLGRRLGMRGRFFLFCLCFSLSYLFIYLFI